MNANPFDTTRTAPDALSQQEVRALNAEFDAGRVTAVATGQVLRVPKQAAGPTAAQVQALTGALDAAGKIHAQAFGSDTIPGLIDALAKCQAALAEFLPKAEPDESTQQVPEGLANSIPPRPASQMVQHTVTALVAAAYKATCLGLQSMERQRLELDLQIEQQRARREDLVEFFGSEEEARLAAIRLERSQ